MITRVADIVSSHPLLQGLPGDTVAQVAGCARNTVIPPGALLIREGEPADTLYLLRHGSVSVEVHGPGRGPVVIETLGPGNAAGWSWMFPPYRWHFDVRAQTLVRAVAVDGACLRAKADSDPAFGYELMKRLGSVILERLQASRLRLLDLYGDGHAR